ncbi:MAG: hypothetical protein PHV00_05910 [Syntrophales bacterium]|jgi:hypothetical protein|nr:hypothetical protein [Syntrophales bacterium]
MVNNNSISFPFSHNDMQIKVAYTGNYPVYIGRARPGELTSASGWQIAKVTYDSNYNVTALQFASGTNDYDKVWDDRATYTYS